MSESAVFSIEVEVVEVVAPSLGTIDISDDVIIIRKPGEPDAIYRRTPTR